MQQHSSPSVLTRIRSYLIYVLMVPFAMLANFNALVLGPFLDKKLLFKCVMWAFCYPIIYATRWICGVNFNVIGRENLPQHEEEGHVIMSNHQSSWETFFLQILFAPNTVILKKELAFIPFFGWALALLKPIFIDRSDRRSAMNQVLTKGAERLKRGEDILIFPEGTRMHIHQQKAFSKGGAVLASKAGVDIIPVAHNAGVCWPARSWIKYPGLITVSIGPAISVKNRKYTDALNEAEEWIQKEAKRLVQLELDRQQQQPTHQGIGRLFMRSE